VLRSLRRRIADRLQVPAYRVFNDRTLRSMAQRRPANEEELREVPGVGDVTLQRFGAAWTRARNGPPPGCRFMAARYRAALEMW